MRRFIVTQEQILRIMQAASATSYLLKGLVPTKLNDDFLDRLLQENILTSEIMESKDDRKEV